MPEEFGGLPKELQGLTSCCQDGMERQQDEMTTSCGVLCCAEMDAQRRIHTKAWQACVYAASHASLVYISHFTCTSEV
jgi:hypothetical protein